MAKKDKTRKKLNDQSERFFKHHYFGLGKIKSKGSRLIHGRRTYAEQIRIVSKAAYDMGVKKLKFITPEMAQEYLERCRDKGLSQKYLSTIRVALERVVYVKEVGKRLMRVEALPKHERSLKEQNRAYTAEQLSLIYERLTPQGKLSLLLAYNAGLRAEEILTLQRRDEASPSTRRDWIEDRFKGREPGLIYIVTGKNGLRREVMIEKELAGVLETLRFEKPELIHDRKLPFKIHYDVLGGLQFSSAFSKASRQVLGWSLGAHGLRFSYAQRRIDEEMLGVPYQDAKLIVSQELGHFREDITERYIGSQPN